MIDLINSFNFDETTPFFTEICRSQPEYEINEDPEEGGEISYIYRTFECVVYDHIQFRKFYCKEENRERKFLNYITCAVRKYCNNHVEDNIKTDKIFKDIFSDCYKIIKPKIYNELIAYKCGLIPFYYRLSYDKNSNEKVGLLTSANYCDKIVSIKLDAYEILTQGFLSHGTQNNKMNKDRELYECILGSKLTSEIFEVLLKQVTVQEFLERVKNN